MTRSARLSVLGTAALAVLVLGACRKTPPATPEPEPAVPSINQDSINRVRDSVAADDARRRAEQARQDSIANAAAVTRRFILASSRTARRSPCGAAPCAIQPTT